MYEVTITPTGDSAEADSPEAAVVACRTLLTDAQDNGCGRPRAAIYAQGRLVRGDLSLADLPVVSAS